MPHAKRVTSYRPHKLRGQARVILDGKHVYLGVFGSPQSRETCARLIAEHFAGTGAMPVGPAPASRNESYPDLSVNELLLRYLQFAEAYYVQDGRPTGEADNLKDAMRPLRTLYGTSRTCGFRPRTRGRAGAELVSRPVAAHKRDGSTEAVRRGRGPAHAGSCKGQHHRGLCRAESGTGAPYRSQDRLIEVVTKWDFTLRAATRD